jgi:hypothetical protein
MAAFRHEKPVCVKRPERRRGGLVPAALVLTELASHKGAGRNQVRATRESMPTLFRFVITLCILAALGYGAMLALVILVEPNKGEMSERIPSDRINPQNK